MNQNKRDRRGRKEYWPELEKDLKIWIVNQRKDGRKLSTVEIKFRANILAQERLIENFKASDQWCNRFMKRNRLSIRTVTSICQQLPKDWNEKLENFNVFINEKKTDINVQDIGNMDEVPMSFDMPGNFTVDQKGRKT